jgi:hypothetical protein
MYPDRHKEFFNVLSFSNSYLFLGYAAIHSIFIWGSLFFKKIHFIKTSIMLLTGFVIIVVANKFIIEGLFHAKILSAVPFFNVYMFTQNRVKPIIISAPENNQFLFLLAITAIIFWGAAYFRLKEKQV